MCAETVIKHKVLDAGVTETIKVTLHPRNLHINKGFKIKKKKQY